MPLSSFDGLTMGGAPGSTLNAESGARGLGKDVRTMRCPEHKGNITIGKARTCIRQEHQLFNKDVCDLNLAYRLLQPNQSHVNPFLSRWLLWQKAPLQAHHSIEPITLLTARFPIVVICILND
eukprot:6479784-Amphidinium_carterae.1